MAETHSSPNSSRPVKQEKVGSQVSPWLARLIYPLGCYVVLPLYFGRLTVSGQENIPRTGPVIVAPTHRSRWDALIVPYAVGRLASGRDLHYMVSANETRGVQGWFIRHMGGFPVDPEHPGISSVRHSVELLRDNKMLVIFPEGDIYRGQQIHPLKSGIARIAVEVESNHPGSGIKILPVSLKYSQEYPSWGCDIQVDIGLPLTVAEYLDRSTKKSAHRLATELEAVLKELHEQSESMSIAAA